MRWAIPSVILLCGCLLGLGACFPGQECKDALGMTSPCITPQGQPTNQVIVTFAGNGSGRVTSTTPAGLIDCPGTCSGYTLEARLSATADPGSMFDGWSGACSGAGSCSVHPNASNGDQRVTARFIVNAPVGTVNWDGGGDGVLWSDPLNWDTDQLPGTNDNVIINAPGVTVRYATPDTTFVRSIQSDGTLEVVTGVLEATSGATLQDLKVEHDFTAGIDFPVFRTGTSVTIAGSLTASGAMLVGGAWDVAGPVSFGDISAPVGLDGVALTTTTTTTIPVMWELCLGNGSTWTIPAGATMDLGPYQIACGAIALPATGHLVNEGTLLVNGGLIVLPFDNNGLVEGNVEVHREGTHGGTFRGPIGSAAILTFSPPAPTPSVVETIRFLPGSSIDANAVTVSGGQVRIGGRYRAVATTVQGGSDAFLEFEAGADVATDILVILGGTLLVQTGHDLLILDITLRGTLNVGHVNGNAIVATDRLTFDNGVLKGLGTTVINPGGVMSLQSDQYKQILDGHTIELRGLGLWHAGPVGSGQGSLLNITGTFSMRHDGDLTWDGALPGTGGPLRILNNGVLRKDPIGTAGTTTMIVCYDNASTGTVEVVAGVLDLQDQCP